MAALKKPDLYRLLRASCDELRGGMGASQYKECDNEVGDTTAEDCAA